MGPRVGRGDRRFSLDILSPSCLFGLLIFTVHLSTGIAYLKKEEDFDAGE
jgi:hypothetical protein